MGNVREGALKVCKEPSVPLASPLRVLRVLRVAVLILLVPIVAAVFGNTALALPLGASPHSASPAANPVERAEVRCEKVDGRIVCGLKKKTGEKKKAKPKKEDTGLSECTIQQPGSGGGCKTGFKRVCEKLKSGKQCCGCVPDKAAQTPEKATPAGDKLEDQPCFELCAGKCAGSTAEARDACIVGCLESTNCTRQ